MHIQIRKHIFEFIGIKPTRITQFGDAANAKPGAVSLANDFRGFGSGLLGMGIFFVFGLGRLLSITVEGVPVEVFIGAMIVEFVVAILCFIAALRTSRANSNE